MTEQNDFLSRQLDLSNFKALIASAEKPVPNETQLKSANEAALRAQINQIRDYAKSGADADFVQANRHLLAEGAAPEKWTAGGNISFAGSYAWSLGGGVAFPGDIPLAFLYGATGKSWKAWGGGTIVIMGSFVVDPEKIVHSSEFHTEDSPIGRIRKGPCNFTISVSVLEISVITISFFSTSGVFWGTLNGTGAFGGGFSVEGQADLVWQGWKPPEPHP